MLSGAARAKLVAALLLGLFLFAVAVWTADSYVQAAYRHVEVEVSNVDGTARIDVNCRRALTVGAGEDPQRVDLGWLGPGDRVYLSEYNERGAAAWGFTVIVNGEAIPEFKSQAGLGGEGTGPYGVAMAQLVTASGERIGTVGCGLPGLVSTSLANYQQAPEMRAMLDHGEAPPLWDPPRSPFALIEGLADLLPLFAVFGFIAAISMARVRDLVFGHRIISGAVGGLNLLIGLGLTSSSGSELFWFWLEGIGLILLLVAGVVAVWPHTGSCCLTSCSTPDPKPNPE